jgi:hypothetical protein
MSAPGLRKFTAAELQRGLSQVGAYYNVRRSSGEAMSGSKAPRREAAEGGTFSEPGVSLRRMRCAGTRGGPITCSETEEPHPS